MISLYNLLSKENWQEQATCAQTDVELFFPETMQGAGPALVLCADCPVREECVEYGDAVEAGTLDWRHLFGVLGGETPKQRAARRKAALAA